MKKSILVIVIATFVNQASAQQSDLEAMFEGTVQLATGYEKPARLAPGVVSTITKEEITALGAVSFDEVMERVAGVVVQRNRVNDPIYTFRGVYSELNPHVLILVDGTPIADPVAGGRPIAWNNLVSNIEKIEIVRGPGAALFGADAFVGVVNIITKGAVREEISEIGVFGGSFGAGGGHLIQSVNLGDVRLTATLQGKRTKGDENQIALADAQSFLDGLTGTMASNAPTSLNTSRSEVLFRIDMRTQDNLHAYASYNGFFNTGSAFASSFEASDANEFNVHQFSSGATYDAQIGQTSIQTKGSVLLNNVSATTLLAPIGAAAPAPPFVFPFDGVNLFKYRSIDARIELNATRDIAAHTVRGGIGGIHQQGFDIEDDRNFLLTPLGPTPTGQPDLVPVELLGQPPVTVGTTREVFYAFIQDEWRLAEQLTLTIGARYDYYDDFGDTINPRASLVWTPTLNTTVKFLYGSAFRAPTFLEFASLPGGAIVSGNSNLVPETIDTFELALEHRFDQNLTFSVNGYYFMSDNAIEVIDTLTVPTFDNGEGQRGHGVELSFNYDPTRFFSLEANYSIQNTEQRESDTRVANAPKHIAFADIGVNPTNRLSAHAILSYVGNRTRAPGDPRPMLDDYLRTDLSVRYTPAARDGLTLSLSLRNAFNADTTSPTTSPQLAPGDFPGEGRRFIASITANY